jgi:rhodanese-related sulfurtransferase
MSADTVLFGADDLDRLRRDHPHVRVIDVRSPSEFSVRHIPGSRNVPLADIAEHLAELTAPDVGPVVLVCETGGRARTAQRRLAAAGLPSVHVLTGGAAGWEASGRALVRAAAGRAPWALERQVRLVAGGIVAAAVAASVVWPPARFLAGAVGAGLVIAALTDTCAMGAALARLPYNTRPRRTSDAAGSTACPGAGETCEEVTA